MDEGEEEVAEAFFVVEVGLDDLLDLGFFGVVGEAAGGVGEEFFGEALAEELDVVDEPGFEFAGVFELGSLGEGDGGVDGLVDLGPLGSPAADGGHSFRGGSRRDRCVDDSSRSWYPRCVW